MSLAQGLGWFSVGLGAAQVLAPRTMARLIGIEESGGNVALMRALGMRELASGVGIFSQKNDRAFLWGRVIGDMMDLALLGVAAASARTDKRRLAGAALAVAGATALDMIVARQRSNPEVTDVATSTVDEWDERADEADAAPRVHEIITINRPHDEVARLWPEIARRPDVGDHLGSAEVSFHATPRGETEVRVEVEYEPRGGKLGAMAAKVARKDPGSHIHRELRHAKQIIEVGEVVHSDASIHRGKHPAQPDREVRI
ncbi:MAG TPA: hypothetical protein VJ867_10015 [Gemmatimonadaceae bacterium]|nr:hypothetical protein [Gemmatimonadaceae bacterium]